MGRTVGLFLTVALGLSCVPVAVLQAQNPDVKPGVGYGIALTGPGGLYAYVPNRWGMLHVAVVNRKKDPLELFSATFFDVEPTLQYGRKIWLPPRSRMETWHPVKIPSKLDADGKTVRFHSLVMDAAVSQEVLIRTDTGQMTHEGFLQVGRESHTGVIYDLSNAVAAEADATIDLVAGCRTQQLMSRKVSSVTEPIFLPGEESLQALDQLVICDSRPTRDAAGLLAIRRWLHRGGHLWVMLDQVEPDLLEMLLGDEFQCQIVDRVSLTKVSIESTNTIVNSSATAEYDQPVNMVRVLASDVEVAYTVNGWPAAFWKSCGEGRLLVTTLGPRGWMQLRGKPAPATPPRPAPGPGPGTRRSPPPPVAIDIGALGKYIPNDPMAQLGSEFLMPRLPEAITAAVLDPIVQEYVGYNIPSRWLIVGLLVGFSGLLALAGVWLWRIGRLEWLGGVGPALAIVVSLVLVGAGRQQRQAVPATAATMQYIQSIPGTDDFLAEGQLGLYMQDSGQTTLGAHEGGWIDPEMGGLEGTTRRMIWTDLDKWQWQNLPATAGLRTATFRRSGEAPQRLRATAMFGPDGLTGRVETGGKHQIADALVATAGGRIGVDIAADGAFTARATRVFSSEQYLGADLLSDEQNRRRKTLQHLLYVDRSDSNDLKRIDFPSRPLLMFWTEPWDFGFEFTPGSRSLGSALITVPLDFQRPPTGTIVSIPSPLLLFRATRGPDGSQPSGLWDPRRREWTEKSAPSATWLKFQVPPVLLPLETLGGRLVVRVTGPMGKLEIAGVRQGKIETLKTWMDPVGTLELPIESGDLLTAGADGGILLRVSGGDPDRPELNKTETADGPKVNFWQIQSLDLDLKAKTADVVN